MAFLNPSAAEWTYPDRPANPEVEPFHRNLPDYAVTPLVALPSVAKELSLGHVLVKDESNRFGLPAFKILGASWAVHRAVAVACGLNSTSTLKEVGKAAQKNGIRLTTATEGNWGRSVARMAKYLQIESTIFVPDFMDVATQDKIRSEGAKVVVVDGDYDQSIEDAKAEAEKGALLVIDVSWDGYEEVPEWVVEGYQTMLIETDQQLQHQGIGEATHVVASVGAGVWAQSVVCYYKGKPSNAAVITVEPTTAASLKTSLEAGKITPITTGHTIMNGMNCGTISTTAWEVLSKGVSASIAVSDVDVHQDLQYLHSLGVKNGPCGAATYTAVKNLVHNKKLELGLDETSVVVLFSTEGARDYVVPQLP